MPKVSPLASLIVVASLLGPSLLAIATVAAGARPEEARGAWVVRAFDEATPPVSVLFEEGATNATYHVPVPNSGTVVSATITIEGEARYTLKGTPTDFSGDPAAGHMAYSSGDGQYPPVGSPSTFKANPFDPTQEGDVSYLDGTTVTTQTSWSNNPPPHEHPYHMFDIKVNNTDMARLRVEWDGWGYNSENSTYTSGAQLYIWDQPSSSWRALASYRLNETTPAARALGATLTSPYDYTSLYGHVYLLAFGQQDEKGPGMPYLGEVATDYVSATVLRNDTLQLPSDVSLAVGGGAPLWSRSGDLTGQVTVGAAEGLGAALQAYVGGVAPAPGNVSVPLTFKTGAATMGAVRVRAMAVSVREPVNRAPTFLGAANVTMTEDTDLPDALDLWDHFTDDIQGHDLSYAVVWEQNASAVHATIALDGHHVDLRAAAPDWAGKVGLRFSATDAWGLKAVSTDFCVTVTEVNDAPTLDPVPNLYLQEDLPFELNLSAHDPDLPYGDVLTFSDDTPLFDVDTRTGRIAFTPVQEQVGTWVVNVTVADSRGASARITLTVDVAESNDPPAIVDPGVLVAYEDHVYAFNFTAVDPDVGDHATWVLVGGVGSMRLGAQNGRLTYLPRTGDVGWHNLSVIATDGHGASSQLKVTIHVLNSNDAPQLEAPPAAHLKEGALFTFSLKVTDEDLGMDPDEHLTFTVDPPLFPIAPNGTVSYTPTNDDVGTYTLNVTVRDAHGANASVLWDVDVANVDQAPTIEPLPDQAWTEHQPVHVQVVAHDIDKGDSLTFYDTTSMFEIDPRTGEINFTPRQADVGTHDVTIRVMDASGAEARMVFEAIVKAVNDPPVVSVRADTTGAKLRQGDSLSLAAVASDVDTPRDELGFTWTLDGKEAGKGDSLVLHRLAPGHHNATVAVSDGETTTTASYGFDVEAVKKGTDWVGILVGVVVLVVALVLVYRFLARPLVGRLMGMGGGQDVQGGEQGDQNPPDGQR